MMVGWVGWGIVAILAILFFVVVRFKMRAMHHSQWRDVLTHTEVPKGTSEMNFGVEGGGCGGGVSYHYSEIDPSKSVKNEFGDDSFAIRKLKVS